MSSSSSDPEPTAPETVAPKLAGSLDRGASWPRSPSEGSWLLIVYLLDGRDVLRDIKLNLQVGRAGQMQSVNSVLVRSASMSEHLELLVVYATPEFFQVANQPGQPDSLRPRRESAIFIINEDTHMGDPASWTRRR